MAAEYLTEKQLDVGPVLIDLDFRYEAGTTERQHDDGIICDVLKRYVRFLSKMVVLPEKYSIKAWVMEKPHVNALEDKTKDGVHIIIGVAVSKQLRAELREHVLADLTEEDDDCLIHQLPLTNTMDDVLDISVARG